MKEVQIGQYWVNRHYPLMVNIIGIRTDRNRVKIREINEKAREYTIDKYIFLANYDLMSDINNEESE